MVNDKPSIYPEVKKGALADDTSSYGVPIETRGPKMGSVQGRTIVVGVVLIVVFGAVMIYAFITAFQNNGY